MWVSRDSKQAWRGSDHCLFTPGKGACEQDIIMRQPKHIITRIRRINLAAEHWCQVYTRTSLALDYIQESTRGCSCSLFVFEKGTFTLLLVGTKGQICLFLWGQNKHTHTHTYLSPAGWHHCLRKKSGEQIRSLRMLSPALSPTHILPSQSVQNCTVSPANICRRQSNLASSLFADGTADPDTMWRGASFQTMEGNNEGLFKTHHSHHITAQHRGSSSVTDLDFYCPSHTTLL